MATTPLRTIVTWKIKPGKKDAFVAAATEATNRMKANEPGASSIEWFLAPDGVTCTIVEVYKDNAAAMAHMQGEVVAKFLPKLMEVADLGGIQALGTPSPEVEQMLKQFNANISKHFLGYTR